MKKMTCVFSLFFAVWLCHAASNDTPVISTRVQFFSLIGDVPGGVFWKPDRDWVEVELPDSYLKDPVTYRGPNPIRFYRKLIEEGQETYEVLSECLVPEKTGALIVLFQHAEETLTVTPVVLGDALPAGAYILLNRLPVALEVSLDGVALRIEADTRLFHVPENPERRAIPVSWKASVPSDPSARPTQTSWFYHPAHWHLVVFEPEGEGINVRSVTRFPDP